MTTRRTLSPAPERPDLDAMIESVTTIHEEFGEPRDADGVSLDRAVQVLVDLANRPYPPPPHQEDVTDE